MDSMANHGGADAVGAVDSKTNGLSKNGAPT